MASLTRISRGFAETQVKKVEERIKTATEEMNAAAAAAANAPVAPAVEAASDGPVKTAV